MSLFQPSFAHSLPGRPQAEWEDLGRHLNEVAEQAKRFASCFGWGEIAFLAGLLHDIGKNSTAFQHYLRQADETARGPDHSTAGAREAEKAYPGSLGRMLAYVVAGHHAGLSDFADLNRRLRDKTLDCYAGWEKYADSLADLTRLVPTRRLRSNTAAGFTHSVLIRMLFSCLVDADSICTERFVSQADGAPVDRGSFLLLDVLRDRLRCHMAGLQDRAGAVNVLRNEVLRHAVRQATRAPGLFTLTVPTGGGKTLASLSFALEHAVIHGLRRVVYVIPFTSVIEQTAQVFRDALGTSRDILEHHASFDWAPARGVAEADSEGQDGLRKLQRASENWDVPIVVTTAVQFYESLFANRRSRCRKLHNLSGAVIVLDEAQAMPVHLLRPSLAMLEELTANYDASVVLCTATQPAWRLLDGAIVDAQKRPAGLDIPASRELAPDPAGLYTRLQRVTVTRLEGPVTDTQIAGRFAERPQMLCIVNARAHARALYGRIADLPGAVHLTTLMCPVHRQAVLARARADLVAHLPVRLVATSLIEAGVDIDFPEVWRAAAGLDSIAQAAGRCNREGKPALGRVVVFEPAEAPAPRELAAFWQAAQPALRRHAEPLAPAAIRDYFHELYFTRGAEGLDAARLDGERWPILREIADRAPDHAYPFASIAKAFRLIDDATRPVVVPYDEDARALLHRVAAMHRPRTEDLRQLQRYVVGLPPRARDEWLAAGVLRPVHAGLGDALLRFEDLAHYRAETGVDLQDTAHRAAELNVIA